MDLCGKGEKTAFRNEACSRLSSPPTGASKPSPQGLQPRRDFCPIGITALQDWVSDPPISNLSDTSQWLHHLLRRVLLGNERHLEVGAYQLSPEVLLAVLGADAFLHKVHLVNDDLA